MDIGEIRKVSHQLKRVSIAKCEEYLQESIEEAKLTEDFYLETQIKLEIGKLHLSDKNFLKSFDIVESIITDLNNSKHIMLIIKKMRMR